MRRPLFISVLVVAVLILAALLAVEPVDRICNRAVETPRPVPVSAQALHDSLWISDFHSDALLWPRNLLDQHAYGLADLPRVRAGGIELVVLAATTRMHATSNYHRTAALLDILPFLAIGSNWPPATWFSAYERARFLAWKAGRECARSHDALRLIRTGGDLDALVQAQASGDSVVGAVLSLEGLHAIEGDIGRVDSLFAAGYRIFGIAHMYDNDIGGSSAGWRKGGITPLGRRVVARIDELGGIIDLAHASRATIDDVLSITSRPVVVSHTGLTSTCPGPRNLPDDSARRVAERGGIIAIGFWKAAVCGKDTRAVARAIHHAIDVVGVEHVALGSDFDGGVRMPFDTAHINMLTAALLEEGLTPDQIRRVMGENEKAFLLANLPAQ